MKQMMKKPMKDMKKRVKVEIENNWKNCGKIVFNKKKSMIDDKIKK